MKLEKISTNGRSIFFLFFCVYMGVALWMVAKYQTTVILEFTKFAHDNSAHLYIPLTVVQNGDTSKFANLGTVWLFLYHIVLIPLVMSDYLYKTGLAGSIINALCVAGSAVVIQKIVHGKEGLIAATLFGFNIYSIIHASSSYMIPLGQFLAVFSLIYVYDYLKNASGKSLTKAVFLIMLSTTARYESWPMALMLAGLIIYNETKRGRRWRIFSHIPLIFFGIAGWIVYNWAVFGNPFEFITHPSPGAAGYYFKVISKLIKPWTIDLAGIGSILLKMLGPLVVILPFGIWSYLREKNGWQFLFFMLSSSILLLAEGPYLLIKDHALYYYFSFPFFFVLIGNGLRPRILTKRRLWEVMMVLLIAGYFSYQMMEMQHLTDELDGARYVYFYNKHFSDVINQNRDGGYVLYSSIIGSYYFSVIEGVKARYIVDEYDNPVYEEISSSPWTHNVSVVILPDRNSYTKLRKYFTELCTEKCYVVLYYENKTWRAEFLTYYKPIFNSSIKLYNVPVIIYGKRARDSFNLLRLPKLRTSSPTGTRTSDEETSKYLRNGDTISLRISFPYAHGEKAGSTIRFSPLRKTGTLISAPTSSFSLTAGCSWPIMKRSPSTSLCPWTIFHPPASNSSIISAPSSLIQRIPTS